MTHLIECSTGEVFEVTGLFKVNGDKADSVVEANHMVVKLAENNWQVIEIGCGKVHRLQ